MTVNELSDLLIRLFHSLASQSASRIKSEKSHVNYKWWRSNRWHGNWTFDASMGIRKGKSCEIRNYVANEERKSRTWQKRDFLLDFVVGIFYGKHETKLELLESPSEKKLHDCDHVNQIWNFLIIENTSAVARFHSGRCLQGKEKFPNHLSRLVCS